MSDNTVAPIVPVQDAEVGVQPVDIAFSPVPLPSIPSTIPSRHAYAIINDDRAIMALIEVLLDRAGLTQAEVARRMGVTINTVNQYRWLRKKRPSIRWITRLAEACGARLVVEWPNR
jgi:hypothetical protein